MQVGDNAEMLDGQVLVAVLFKSEGSQGLMEFDATGQAGMRLEERFQFIDALFPTAELEQAPSANQPGFDGLRAVGGRLFQVAIDGLEGDLVVVSLEGGPGPLQVCGRSCAEDQTAGSAQQYGCNNQTSEVVSAHGKTSQAGDVHHLRRRWGTDGSCPRRQSTAP